MGNPNRPRPRTPIVAALLLLVVVGAGAAYYVLGMRRGGDRRDVAGVSKEAESAPKKDEASSKPGGAAPEPDRAAEEARGPVVWAVVAGVDEYDDEAIPQCHGASADARAVADWLRKDAGWGEDHVLLLDSLGEARPDPNGRATRLRPTRENLEFAVRTWLARRARAGDVAVVYFAGQAVGVTPTEGGEPGGEFLLPTDARLASPGRTGWAIDEAIDPVAGAGVSVVCWLDTSLQGRGRPIPVEGGSPTGNRLLQRLTRWPGSTAWLAADGRVAREAARVGERGPFVAALVRGLGQPGRPRALAACLDALNRDRDLAAQGFRAMGGVGPALDLWSGQARREAGASRELLLQRGHARAVLSLAFTADGERLVSAGDDSVVKFWRVGDRTLVRSLPYHLVGVTALALAPGGRLLASGDGSGRLRIWDLREQREVDTGPLHLQGVADLAFLPGGERLATLDRDGRAWLWDVSDPGQAARSEAVSSSATGLACANEAGKVAVALGEMDGKIRLLAADGSLVRTVDGPGGVVTAGRVAISGRLLAAAGADDPRKLVVWDVESGESVRERAFEAPIDRIDALPDGGLAVGAGTRLSLMAAGGDPARDGPALDLPDSIRQLAAANGGRVLAACTTRGDLAAWRVDEAGVHQPIPLEGVAEAGAATGVALSPDGRTLAAGGQDGSVRFWDLAGGRQRPSVPPRRGQVVAIDASKDARYLLQVTRDRQAQVWDLAEGRTLTTIAGAWATGAIMPDGSTVALTDAESGDVVLADRATGRRKPVEFARPTTTGEPCRFGPLAVSPDDVGRLVAAGAVDGPLEGPIACVWESATGRLVKTLRGHDDPHRMTAVDFSTDGRWLLTASEDGTVRVWDLSGDAAEPEPARVLRADPKGEAAVTAAAFDPTEPGRIAAGTLDGRILIWEPGRDEPTAVPGSLDGDVRAVAFARDGRRLVASGGPDKSVRLWTLGGPPRPVRLEPAPNHDEIVNDVLAWPVGGLVASAGDDTTIRIWDPEGRRLLGTLSAEQGTSDWVVYTPDGLFDSSIGGEAQVTWRVGDEVLTLDQFEDRSRVFSLADALRQGRKPEPTAPPTQPAPRVAVDPLSGPVADGRDQSLTIRLGEAGLGDVRLYQDGIPVALEAGVEGDGRRLTIPVRLRPGVNRFHAMATRPGSAALDGRSNVVEIRYDGPEAAGRIHVVALGVSRYERADRALQFADDDAVSMADYLHQNAANAEREAGLRLVLTDDRVTEQSVDEAFRRLRDAVAGRPEDTVVVFLAGHTDVLANRYYLLLPKFPFPDRAGALPSDVETILPYASIYRNLARLGALQRLVVVDACQADAISDDPAVRRIREAVDGGAQRAKTAYFLAARRGEPAGEVSALEHGLLTYVLLKGMGDRNLKELPDLTVFRDLPRANTDGDEVVTTAELRGYADATLPLLASNFENVVLRAGSGPQGVVQKPSANLGQATRFQATEASFPLVLDPADAGSAPAGR